MCVCISVYVSAYVCVLLHLSVFTVYICVCMSMCVLTGRGRRVHRIFLKSAFLAMFDIIMLDFEMLNKMVILLIPSFRRPGCTAR